MNGITHTTEKRFYRPLRQFCKIGPGYYETENDLSVISKQSNKTFKIYKNKGTDKQLNKLPHLSKTPSSQTPGPTDQEQLPSLKKDFSIHDKLNKLYKQVTPNYNSRERRYSIESPLNKPIKDKNVKVKIKSISRLPNSNHSSTSDLSDNMKVKKKSVVKVVNEEIATDINELNGNDENDHDIHNDDVELENEDNEIDDILENPLIEKDITKKRVRSQPTQKHTEKEISLTDRISNTFKNYNDYLYSNIKQGRGISINTHTMNDRLAEIKRKYCNNIHDSKSPGPAQNSLNKNKIVTYSRYDLDLLYDKIYKFSNSVKKKTKKGIVLANKSFAREDPNEYGAIRFSRMSKSLREPCYIERQEYTDPATEEERSANKYNNSTKLFFINYKYTFEMNGLLYLTKANKDDFIFTDQFNEDKSFKIKMHLTHVEDLSTIEMGLKHFVSTSTVNHSFDFNGTLYNCICKKKAPKPTNIINQVTFNYSCGFVSVQADQIEMLTQEVPLRNYVFFIKISSMKTSIRIKSCTFSVKPDHVCVNKTGSQQMVGNNIFKYTDDKQ